MLFGNFDKIIKVAYITILRVIELLLHCIFCKQVTWCITLTAVPLSSGGT